MAIQPFDFESILGSLLKRAGERHIRCVHFAVGELVDMTDEAILASWVDITKGTPAEGTLVHIRRVPAELQCMACFHKYHPDSANVSCPRCGSVGARVIAGEEFSVKSVDLDSS